MTVCHGKWKERTENKEKKHLPLFFLFFFFNWCHMCGCQTTNTWLVSQAPSYQHENNFFKFKFFVSGVPSIPKLPCKTSFRHFLENPPTCPSQNVKHSNIKWHCPQGRKFTFNELSTHTVYDHHEKIIVIINMQYL